jgi:hypothetical protein
MGNDAEKSAVKKKYTGKLGITVTIFMRGGFFVLKGLQLQIST